MENASRVFVLLFLVYLYKALRNFYGQGHFIATVKFTLLNTYYAFLGLVGVAIVAIVSFMGMKN
ncbi:MAG: hypothetical protein WA143_11240 [Lutibacter sp.]